jgi:DnaA-homolog protein
MTKIQQLALDLGVGHNLHTFSTFVVGKNNEIIDFLLKITREPLSRLPSRMIYLWGDHESGKTHLLHSLNADAMQNGLSSVYLTHYNLLDDFTPRNQACIYCIDDIHSMREEQHIAVFNLINEVRNQPNSAIITTGNYAPRDLLLREDVRTRMGWGLVYQLHDLEDNDKKQALMYNGKARGIILNEKIVDWLLQHSYKDMNSLIDVLNALDMYSLQHKKPVSLPMLKRMLQEWAA